MWDSTKEQRPSQWIWMNDVSIDDGTTSHFVDAKRKTAVGIGTVVFDRNDLNREVLSPATSDRSELVRVLGFRSNSQFFVLLRLLAVEDVFPCERSQYCACLVHQASPMCNTS
jgi:hypothetical protein